MAKKKAEKKSKKKPGGPSEQAVEEEVNKQLGMGEQSSPYFTADVKKDPSGWLREFATFLDETASDLLHIQAFKEEDEYEIARNLNNPDQAKCGSARFKERYIKPHPLEIEAEKHPMTEREYLARRCEQMYVWHIPLLKKIRSFLGEVSGAIDASGLIDARPNIEQGFTILNLVFTYGYTWLASTLITIPVGASKAEEVQWRLLATSVFAEKLRQHQVRTKLEELASRPYRKAVKKHEEAVTYADRETNKDTPPAPGPPVGGQSEGTGGDAIEEVKEMVAGLTQKFDELSEAKQCPEWVDRKRTLTLREFLEEVCDYKVPTKIRNLKRRLTRMERMPPHIEPYDKGTSFRYYMKDLYYWWIDNQVELNLPDMVLA